jgi:hypothetical protein
MERDYASSGKATGRSNCDLSAFDAEVTVRSDIPHPRIILYCAMLKHDNKGMLYCMLPFAVPHGVTM